MTTYAYQPSLTESTPEEAMPESQFAFAQIQGDICLVQVACTSSSTMSSALMPVSNVKVFRHEFITIFRYSHSATVHPADIHVLYPIDDHCTLYEEDKGTVFLARDVMAQLQKLIALSRGPAMRRPHVAHARLPSRSLRTAKLA